MLQKIYIKNILLINILNININTESWKTNSLFDPRSQQTDIDKIYLHLKDPSGAKYTFLINKWESARLNILNYYFD